MTKYVYTLSSTKNFIREVQRSIRSLSMWVDPSDIVVFYTPPHDDRDKQKLEELGVDLRLVDNRSQPFSISSGKPGYYGEKTHIGAIEDETAVFLDCDTLVLGDITETIEGDFDFKARPGTAPINDSKWETMFSRFDRPVHEWMPNAGFMIFKNGTHKKIENEWLEFVNTDLGFTTSVAHHQEQYALALTLSEYDTKRMAPHEHVMEWNGEFPRDGIVYHLETQDPTENAGIASKLAQTATAIRLSLF